MLGRSGLFTSQKGELTLLKLRGNVYLRKKSQISSILKTNRNTCASIRFSSSYGASRMASSLLHLRTVGQNAISYFCSIFSSPSQKVFSKLSAFSASKFNLYDSSKSEFKKFSRLRELVCLFTPLKTASFKLQKEESIKYSESLLFSNVDDFVKQQNSQFEKAISDLISASEQHPELPSHKRNEISRDDKPSSRAGNQVISQVSIENRSKFLVKSLVTAVSCKSQILRLEEMCKHLHLYPQEKRTLIKEGAHRVVLQLREESLDADVWSQARETLALLGYVDPPLGYGVRILSIDGGGTRGVMAIEILRQLEMRTGKKVYELFDFICGVSTGAILALLLCGLRMPLDECEVLYKQLSREIFSQSAWWGTGRLVWTHAYYDTNIWVNALKKAFGDMLMTESAKLLNNPKIAAVSTVMNQPTLQAYVFRNYNLPYRVQSPYPGSCSHKMWEAVRASGAAPGYFEEFCLGDLVHQDGGLMINNPSAVAIHEAKLLWPREVIQCVVSIGSGRYVPPPQTIHTSTSLKTKLLKVIDSATDTEAVHITLNDLLHPSIYFRFNPYLTELLSLDENRPEKLEQLKIDAQMYLRRNERKVSHAVSALKKVRGYYQRTKDWVHLQKLKW